MCSGRLGVDCLLGTSVALLDCYEDWSPFEFVGCGILATIRTFTYVIMLMKYTDMPANPFADSSGLTDTSRPAMSCIDSLC